MNIFKFGVAAMVVLSAPAAAQVALYNSETSFNAATTGRTTYGIAAPANGTFQATGGNYTVGGVTISSAEQFLQGDGAYGPAPYLNNINTVGGGIFVFTSLSQSHTALGFNLGSYHATGTVYVTVNGVGGYSFTAQSDPTGGFFGIISDQAITSVNFAALSFGELDIINVTTGEEASSAPEPISWTMMLGGFGSIGSVLRRRKMASGSSQSA